MSEMEQQVVTVLKGWSEAVLRNGGSRFHMSDLIEYVQSSVPGCAPDTVTNAINDLSGRGEISVHPVMGSDGLYSLQPPGRPQITMFGVPSEPTADNKKKKPFTKKQKQAAFNELNAIGEMGPGLTRLHEWLYEQLT